MEIKEFLLLMWRGARYLVLGLLLGVALGVAASILQPPDYEAVTKVLVSRSRQPSTGADILSLNENQLVTTDALMVKTKPVLDDAAYELGTTIDPDNIAVTVLPNTLVIQIKVQDRNPKQAAVIANKLVEILIKQNENILAGGYAATEKALTDQIDQVQKQIDTLQTQYTQMNDASIQEQLKLVGQQTELLKSDIASLEQDINNFPAVLSVADKAALAQKQAQLEQQRSLLNLYQQIQVNLTFTGQPGQGGNREIPSLTNIQSNISLYQQIYLELQNSLETNRSEKMLNAPNVLQMDPAVPPKIPVRPLPVLYVLLGGFAGFALAAGVILLVDHINNPLKNARQVEEALGLPVLGIVSPTASSAGGLVSIRDPSSPGAEAFRALGAAIDMTRSEGKLGTLMIVNAAERISKTATSANLAVAYAHQGKPVTLIDGDIHHPHLHTLFSKKNELGLSNIIGAPESLLDVGQRVEDVEGLTLVTGGPSAHNGSKWMNAEKWGVVLSRFRKPKSLTIVDSPSSETADAQTLASKVDGVLLVIRAEQTSVEVAQATLRRFKLAGAKVLGTILIRASPVLNIGFSARTSEKKEPQRKEERSAGGGKIDEARNLSS